MSLLLMLWLSTMTVVPKNTILVPGATPSASDASTPLPEQGSVAAGRYRNAYFGLSYPIPAGWTRQPAGPPPSDGGSYVLTQFAVHGANVLVTAQDLFFTERPLGGAKELVAAIRDGLAPPFELEDAPAEVTLGGRTFQRVAYRAPLADFHWRVFSTDVRCHALTFTFAGNDAAVLDAAEKAMQEISIAASGPACVSDYPGVTVKTEPAFTSHRYNTIPVRVVVGSDGRVKHVHVLSAFAEQSQAILAALKTWRFEPYRVNGKAVPVETGLVFGPVRHRPERRDTLSAKGGSVATSHR